MWRGRRGAAVGGRGLRPGHQAARTVRLEHHLSRQRGYCYWYVEIIFNITNVILV